MHSSSQLIWFNCFESIIVMLIWWNINKFLMELHAITDMKQRDTSITCISVCLKSLFLGVSVSFFLSCSISFYLCHFKTLHPWSLLTNHDDLPCQAYFWKTKQCDWVCSRTYRPVPFRWKIMSMLTKKSKQLCTNSHRWWFLEKDKLVTILTSS